MMTWTAVPLGELCEINIGRTPSRHQVDYWGAGYPWLSIADMNQGRALHRTKEQITSLAVKNVMGAPVPVGTVLLSFKLSIGKIGISEIPLYTNEAIAALPIRDTKRLDTHFLYWVLRTIDFTRETDRAVMGQTLNKKKLANIAIPVPLLDEQRRIAQLLDSVDALRAKRRAAITLLDNLPQSIFLDMFGDPVSNLGDWPVNRLAQLGSLDRGVSKHRPRNAPGLLGGKYPLIQTGDVAASQGYIEEWKSTYSDAGLAQSRLWASGTLCITIAANIAKTGILKFDACFPDSVVGFSSDPDTVEYVQVWLSFLQKTLERLAPESAQKNINLAVLRELKIPNPGPGLISSFAERIRAAESLKTALRAHLDKIEALFTSLQHRAFRGELWDTRAS